MKSGREIYLRILFGLALCLPAVPSAFAQPALISGGPVSFAPLVRAVAPEVVGIAGTETGGQPGTSIQAPRGSSKTLPPAARAAGSGFIISPDGVIVTNDHVIAGAAHMTVTLNDGEKFPARLIGADDLTDLAIIKIKSPHNLIAAHWGDSGAVQVGDWVLAAGNPFALGNSFSAGIISAEGRDIGDGPFDHFLQLDAAINPGNSGGPAFDIFGAVIGVNTAIISPSGGSVGVGFAIPSNTARSIIATLIAHGDVARGWLGVSLADLPEGTKGPVAGAEITAVVADGPAFQAGLSPPDIVQSIDGKTVNGAADLIRAIASVPPGTKVRLGIAKNGRIFTVRVVVDRRPAQLGE